MTASPRQLVWRGRIEAALGLVAPALDLLLHAGDRLSRAVEPEEREPQAALRAEPATAVPGRRRVGPGR